MKTITKNLKVQTFKIALIINWTRGRQVVKSMSITQRLEHLFFKKSQAFWV